MTIATPTKVRCLYMYVPRVFVGTYDLRYAYTVTYTLECP